MHFSTRHRAFDALRAGLREQLEDFQQRSRNAFGDAVAIGAEKLVDFLEGAITYTGIQRMLLEGGNPGRHKTGTMVSSVSFEREPFYVEGSKEIFAFGWFPGHFQDYFEDQDVGNDGIPAARAMTRATAVAIRRARQNMDAVVRR